MLAQLKNVCSIFASEKYIEEEEVGIGSSRAQVGIEVSVTASVTRKNRRMSLKIAQKWFH